MAQRLSPISTIIAFDLHGVVSHVNYLQVLKIAARNPSCIARLTLYSFNPWFLRDVYRLWRTHAVAAAYLHTVEQKYPFLLPCIPFLIAVGNAQKPNNTVIDLIKDLKHRGFMVHLFSNIGDTIMSDFAIRHPDVITLFDAIAITTKQNGYIGKPYDAAFINYLAAHNPDKKTVVFIDNTQRNLDAAQRYGMITIRYTSNAKLIAALTTT